MRHHDSTDAPMPGDAPRDLELTRTEEFDGTFTFVAGDVLVGRFRIVRFIARGGMGEVYEAEDLELREPVALKTISADRLADPRAADRFRREVQLARKITHPNVCRTFDVFKAEASGSRPEVTFVTMELLRGRTLADVLRERGCLPVSEAEVIARQIGGGLQAAHAVGVVHRDFKSRNIVLVADPAADTLRSVVTDFGIAVQVLTADTTAGPSSDRMQIMGTPAYMAPEQLTGGQVTSRTDVYAFGLVLYEMVCGVLPFQADTPVAVALKRLSDAPDDPRQHAGDLPETWVSVITKCLARNPDERFTSVDAALLALTGISPEPKKRWPALVATVAFIALAAGAGTYHFLIRTNAFDAPAIATPARRTIALLGFRNLANDPDLNYISTALREGIGTELGLAPTLRTVPGETVERMKIELGLPSSDTLAADTLRRVHANLGTDLVIVGAYLVQGDDLRVFTRVQDVHSADVVSSASHVGSQRNLAGLIAALGTELRSQLAGESSSDAAEGFRGAVLPTQSSVQRLYAEGLDALRRFDARAARDLLEKAVAQQPDFPLAHSALAAAWADLGYDAQAARAAASALQFAERLPPAERQWIEARYREASREWERAVELYETLLASDPGNREYGLRLAAALVSAGRPADARRAAEALRSGDDDPDPRVLLAEAIAAGAEGDYRTQQQTANRAAAAARAHGAPLLTARALIDEAGALLRLDDPTAAEAASHEARRLYQSGGDRHGVARALIQLGNVYRSQDRMQLAEKNLREAFEIGRDLGNKRHTARALNDLANVHFDQRQYRLAVEMYDEVVTIAREVGDRYTEARALSNLASARYALGEVMAARRLDEQALAIQRELGNQSRIAFLLVNMGETALETGDLAGAQRMYEEALAINRELEDRAEEAYALGGLARVHACRGRAEEARTSAEAALRMRRDLGDNEAVTESIGIAGFVAAEAGDVVTAARLLKEALSTGSEADEEVRVRAAALLTGLLLETGQLAEAEGIFTKDVQAAAAAALSHPVQVIAAITEGRIVAARGGRVAGEAILRKAAERARQLEFRTYEMQARLELARSQIVSAPASARRELEKLSVDSRSLGYLSLGTRAAELLMAANRSK